MAELRRERKFVTIVFVDLVGSTARAEVLDPEDVEVELDRYYIRVRRELERFGGTVEKFIGDAVMAVFGAPVAHEDDPERAVRAAIAVREWALSDEGLEVRIGINSGEALVRLDARPEMGEGLAVGDVVNTAARVQSAAPDNGILVGEPTYRATQKTALFSEPRHIEAKGKATPVVVYDVRDLRSSFGIDTEQAPLTQFVGRDNELGLLRGALARARELLEPQLVTIVGVPGIGKSRIVYELSRLVDADPDLVVWRQGRCLPYGDGISLWAVAEMVKVQAGILETDPADLALEKLAKSVEALDLQDEADWIVQRLRPLVGLAESDAGQVSREEQFAAWRHYLEAVAEAHLAVLVFEDLHWADDTLLDFIDELTTRSTGVPLLVLCTARPELQANRPTWGAGRANALTLSLPPLTGEQTATMVGALVNSAMPPDVQHVLLERAGGNPLYAEEFARLLAERSDVDVAVPDTVQGIISARIDGLAPEHKLLLQHAAVIGKVFWGSALARVAGVERGAVDTGLREVERREFIRRERRSSIADDTEYAFRHALVRDVAYGQLPRADRSALHRHTAEWLMELNRVDDHAELIAHHYLAALDFARASQRDVTELTPVAAKALRDGGDRAFALGSFGAATHFYRQALNLTDDGPERTDLLAAWGTARWLADAEGLDTLAEAAERLEAEGRLEQAADALVTLGRALTWRGEPDEAHTRLDAADRLLASLPESPVRHRALLARVAIHSLRNEYSEAWRLLAPELDELGRSGRPDLLARALDLAGLSRSALGDEDGIEVTRRAVTVARDARAVFELQTALNNLDAELTTQGRLHEANAVLEERRETIEKYGGSALVRMYFQEACATHLYSGGEWDRCLDTIEQFFELLPDGTSHVAESNARELRAYILSARSQAYDPAPELERALQVARAQGNATVTCECLAVCADVMLAVGSDDVARDLWQEAHDLAELPGSSLGQDGLTAYADAAIGLGRESDALPVIARLRQTQWVEGVDALLRGDFARAEGIFTRMGHRPAAARAGLRAGGDAADRARDFYRSVGAARYLALT